MNVRDLVNARSIALNWTNAPSNGIQNMLEMFFPNERKMGLDLKWIKGHKGLGVSLAPSNFDAKSTLRPREGINFAETQMAFFRESMLVKEADEQEIMRVQDANDPYAIEVMNRIYDDAGTLIDGAEIVAERMRGQLLFPAVDGSPRIVINANGVQYSYNYDPDGTYKDNNYKAISASNKKWTDHANSDPFGDIEAAQDAVANATGVRPTVAIMNGVTFKHIQQNANVKNMVLAQNTTANVFLTREIVQKLFADNLGLTIIVYDKQYKDEAGTAHKFAPDGFCTLVPGDGFLGKTWHGVTPEERTLQGKPIADVTVLDNGIAIAVTTTEDPVNTKTTVSEIVLPSYERMDETYAIKAF